METIHNKTIKHLSEELLKIYQKGGTGILSCSRNKLEGEIYLISGKLMYLVRNPHRVRRWHRANLKFASHWKMPMISLSDNQLWESQLIHHGISNKNISLTQVKNIVRYTTEECLFELSCYEDLKLKWEEKTKTESGLALALALSLEEVIKIMQEVDNIRQLWDKGGLRVLSPRLAPILKSKVDTENSSILESFDGKLTLWDIAIKQDQNIIELIKVLIPFIRKGVIKFKEIPDLDSPKGTKVISQTNDKNKTKTSPTTTSTTNKSPEKTKITSEKGKALIACIDDSPVVVHNIKKLLTPVGYEILPIPEPMHGFSQLIEHKPDLILLDINMPNANGYSVCQFLRNSPIFEKTPIIILTGQDTNIDRARAKLVGATDFIGKPAEKKVLLAMIEKYLSK